MKSTLVTSASAVVALVLLLGFSIMLREPLAKAQSPYHNPYHSPYHNPYHPTPQPKLSVTPFVTEDEITSQWVNHDTTGRLVLKVNGRATSDQTCIYGCQYGGGIVNNVAGMKNLSSVGFEAKKNHDCNDNFGPGIFIEWKHNGTTNYADVGCGDISPVGTDKGFFVYNIPVSAWTDPVTGNTLEVGDTIESITFACFPNPDNELGQGVDIGPSILDDFKLNGTLLIKDTSHGTLVETVPAVEFFENRAGAVPCRNGGCTK